MTTDTISQTVLFPNLFDKPLLAQFDQPHTSSDGGAVLLKAAEKVYCARGDIENRIKELLDGLQLDRTSCCCFWPHGSPSDVWPACWGL